MLGIYVTNYEVSEMVFVLTLHRSGNSVNGKPGAASGDTSVCDNCVYSSARYICRLVNINAPHASGCMGFNYLQ